VIERKMTKGRSAGEARLEMVSVVNLSGIRTRQIPELDIPDLPGALCKGIDDPDMFFPEQVAGGRKRAKQAALICQGCPVKRKCLDYALDWDREHPDYYERIVGVWGGTTEAERRKMLKEENAA
jgi:WhiB family redox-sensing transcriptional regulator